MKIAFFCTNEFKMPLPKDIIYAPLILAEDIVDGFMEKGHQVTLFASSDTKTKAELVSLDNISFQNAGYKNMWGNFHDQEVVTLYEQMLFSSLIQRALKGEFDVIHIYHQIIHFLPFVELTKTPIIATLHDPITDKRKFVFEKCPWSNKVNYISISNDQREDKPDLNFYSTIYNGIKMDMFKYNETPKDYFLSLSRISPEKGAEFAVKTALEAGEKLILAGPVWDTHYFDKKIKPYIDGKQIIYKGFIERSETYKLYQNAKGFLFPTTWREPFGLVMAEALACGTPVIAFDSGSVSEVVEHGKTGFVIPKENVKEMASAMKKISTIKRSDCRKSAQDRFSVSRMIDDYLKVYSELV